VQLKHAGQETDVLYDATLTALRETTQLNDWLHRRAHQLLEGL
jgi:hypothetical protein